MQEDSTWTNPYTGGTFNSPGASFVDTLILHAMQRKMLYRSPLKKKGYSEREIDAILRRPEKEVKAIAGASGRKAPVPTDAAPPGAPATRFQPTKGRLLLDPFVDALGKTREQRDALRRLFVEAFKLYETQARKSGFPDDIAGALTFFLAAHFSAFHDGSSVSDSGTEAMVRTFQGALGDDLQRASPTDKQRLYEILVMLAGFTLAVSEAAGSRPELAPLRRRVGGDGLKLLLKVEPSRVKITDSGLEIG